MSRKQKKLLIRIIIALILFIPVFIIDKIIDLNTVFNSDLSWLFPLSIYLVIYIFIGYDILKGAFLNIIHGRLLDEKFLMAFATLGAFALGIYTGIKGVEVEGFDEGCAVLIFYQIGEFFESYAVSKSRKSISKLMDIRPDYCNLVKDGEIIKTSPNEAKIDDIIIIYPGERIPLDGILIEGASTLDTKAITGESLPRDVNVGDEIISGTLNLTSKISVKITKEFYDSTVSKILELVSNSQDKKAKAENFITRFARIYTPIVVLSAILLALIPSLITGNYTLWIYRALCFLVVSCPCAFVISIPLSFFSGLGAASRYKILVKGSNYLEKFNKANIFIFDKTGTITKGNFKITKIEPENKKEEILYYASMVEKGSSHPIAKSIMSLSNNNIPDIDIINIPGFGIKGIYNNETILLGNYNLMLNNNINCDNIIESGTILYLAVNNIYKGYILIEDEIKDSSIKTINNLNENNYKTIMLTGDNKNVAQSVSNKFYNLEYYSDLLPQDKAKKIEDVINNKNKKDVVCFCGDGINDAPSLMISDVGIAMGGAGSDAAIEASDIVFMEDDLENITLLKKITKKTMRIVYENIIFSLSIKIIILILSSLGYANMWIAVFGDVGVAVLAILNALRINSKYKKSNNS
ncbi:MAG: cadmium-translocating P-type ATPase [Acholeplasmatales bacterium]|nr:cadmium-translocating P-type ATPase [Acholeplasmatales bacterium]